ncbi:phage tail protein [Massilia sp. BJB1822]|uniref:phage tail protein n=1 Tax=Massilia sp. BJB1822 TaxID=2744470 RepID=UPI001592FE70|nr:hypothetical protein [Massilia sp. BJB1822]
MVADAARLLPPNTSPLERALARTAPRRVLDAAAAAPGGVRHQPPPTFAPWLAAEWQLGEFAPYFESTDKLIAAGLPWLRQRGTTASVKQALSWIGFDTQLEQDGAWLQIDPGDAHAQLRLNDIVHLVRKSLPAHAHFYRMYHGYDLRPLRLDDGLLDGGLLDDDSGILIGGIKLSFAARRTGIVDIAAGQPDHARTTARFGMATYEDRVMLDTWTLDSVIMTDGRFIIGQLITGVMRDLPAEPPTITAHRTLAYSQTVLDGDVVGLDDFNSHLGGAFGIVENPMRLDGDRLDSHDIAWRHIVIDRFSESLHQSPLPAFERPRSFGFEYDAVFTGISGSHYRPQTWTGGWDARPWRVAIPSTITFTNKGT